MNGTSVDGALGIRARDRSIVGTDESTDLWFLLRYSYCLLKSCLPTYAKRHIQPSKVKSQPSKVSINTYIHHS